jgi:hypothetical protein
MELKINHDESVNGAIFWPAEGVENLFKTTRKTRDYEGFFRKMSKLWDMAVPTYCWPQEHIFNIMEELKVLMKI